MKKQKLLIADDEPSILELISNILKQYNYEIYTALNGNIAYGIAIDKQPDLIITDWDMPEISGIELITMLNINDKTKHIPVIMITGIMSSIEYLKQAFDAGAIDFIKKPIDPIELMARTRSMLMLSNYYNQTIKHKDWELTLMSKNVLKNNEFNHRLLKKVEKLQKTTNSNNYQAQKIFDKIISDINHNIRTQAWEQFETYFKNVHPDFLKDLLKKYPSLTPNEIKLCVFLRLNLNSKEIASITIQNSESIDIARYRLRKKLNLTRKENLNSFLMSI